MKIEKWLKENTNSLKGKTIAITGSTGGITKLAVKHFALLGANFIFINRNKDKTNTQIAELKSICPNIKIDFIECDLAKFEQVKLVAETLKQKQIDVLFLAAGIYNIKRYTTEFGYDNVFQTNFISHYYIAKELLAKLKANSGKIVAVSSIAHNYSKIDINNIDFSLHKKHSKVYGNSKRFLTFALQELAKQEDISLAIVHPGLTLTDMTNHYHKSVNWLVKLFIKSFCPSTEKASLSLIKGVFDTTTYHKWIGPKIFNIWGEPKNKMLKTCSTDESKKIFEIAEDIFTSLKKIKKED